MSFKEKNQFADDLVKTNRKQSEGKEHSSPLDGSNVGV